MHVMYGLYAGAIDDMKVISHLKFHTNHGVQQHKQDKPQVLSDA